MIHVVISNSMWLKFRCLELSVLLDLMSSASTSPASHSHSLLIKWLTPLTPSLSKFLQWPSSSVIPPQDNFPSIHDIHIHPSPSSHYYLQHDYSTHLLDWICIRTLILTSITLCLRQVQPSFCPAVVRDRGCDYVREHVHTVQEQSMLR